MRYRGTDYSVPTRFGHCEVLVRGYVHEVVTLVTSNLPFDEWTEVFGSARLSNNAPPFDEISPPAKSASTRRLQQDGNSIFVKVQSVTAKLLR